MVASYTVSTKVPQASRMSRIDSRIIPSVSEPANRKGAASKNANEESEPRLLLVDESLLVFILDILIYLGGGIPLPLRA